MKITTFLVHLQKMQLFSMQPHAVKIENSVHNSNGIEETDLFLLVQVGKSCYIEWELYIKVWGEKADFCSGAWRITDQSESP